MGRSARGKTIKVSDKEWEIIQRARKQLAHDGYGDVEDDLEGYLDDLEEEDDDEDNSGDFLAGLALGAVAAVGAAAVLKFLSDRNK